MIIAFGFGPVVKVINLIPNVATGATHVNGSIRWILECDTRSKKVIPPCNGCGKYHLQSGCIILGPVYIVGHINLLGVPSRMEETALTRNSGTGRRTLAIEGLIVIERTPGTTPCIRTRDSILVGGMEGEVDIPHIEIGSIISIVENIAEEIE